MKVLGTKLVIGEIPTIDQLLQDMAALVEADRAHIFSYDFQARTASVTHEWAEEHLQRKKALYQGLSFDQFPHWDIEAHRRGEAIWLPDTSEMPPSRTKDFYQVEGLKSSLAIPLMGPQGCLGFIGFAWSKSRKELSPNELRLLSFFASMLVSLESLKQSEAKFRTVFNAANVGKSITHGDGKIEVNQALADLLGYTREELMALSWQQITPPEDIPATVEAMRSLLSGEKDTVRYEKRFIRKDGSLVWVDLSSAIQRDAGVKSGLFISAMVDITARVKAEEALRESERFFRETQRAASIGSYKLDLRTGHWQSSEMLDQIFGIGPEYRRDVAGWLELVHPDDRAMMDRYLWEEVVGKRHRFDKVYRVIRPDGTIRWLQGFGEATFDEQGSALTLSGIIGNVTEQKEHAHEKDRLLAALEQADECIIITDLKGTIQYVNPAFERVTGYSAAEAIGRNPRFLKSGKHGPEFYRQMWDKLSVGRAWKGRLENRRKDGSLYTEEATITPVHDAEGKTINYVALKNDLTERLQLEAQLAQANKMESVGRLAGGVAHDFNNMLSVILGFTEMAQAREAKGEFVATELAEIKKAAARSAELTRQLLAFARKQTVAPKVLQLNLAVENTLKMLRRLIGENIALLWEPAPAVCPVSMDPTQLDQVLTNLCVNARDAISGKGRIVLTTSNVEVDGLKRDLPKAMASGAYVRLSIADDGAGMDEQTLAHVFEPFFTTKEMGRGTGLGLATVYGIVKQNGGHIFAKSLPGQGTTFDIYWPRHEQPDAAAAAPVLAAPRRGQECVLVVEDEPSVLRLTKMLLEAEGYQVLSAESPLEALRLAGAPPRPIQALLTDVIMPEMNGLELAKKVRALVPGVRCIYMSGFTADVIARQGVVEDGIDFLSKPFTAKELFLKVREVLDRAQ